LGGEPHRGIATDLLHFPIAVESEPEKVVILRDHLRAGTREVQRECRHLTAEIVDIEHEIVREVVTIPPDDPTHAWIYEAAFVSGGVDRTHARDAKIPRESGVDEGRHEPSGHAVDVDRNVDPALGLDLI